MFDWTQRTPAPCFKMCTDSPKSLFFWCLRSGKIYLPHRAHICLQYREKSCNVVEGKINDLLWESYETFYVLLTVHLSIIFVNNQLDAQFLSMYVYFYSVHVSGSHVPIIRRINCINTTSGICHSL
jgi:hypothetical protein